MALEVVSTAKCFNGMQKVYKHFSKELNCSMNFAVYVPTSSSSDEKFNVVFFLSGLTCTEQNFIQKSGFQQYASQQKLIVVGPDTSPRGLSLPGDSDSWDFGVGAGFYVDSLKEPWSKNYRMYSYVSKELPSIIRENFPTTEKFGICGHRMGGLGALNIGLRNPDLFSSISAFAPISNPTTTDWGAGKAFKLYLGEDNTDVWATYDPTELSKKYNGPSREILIDQGADDEFLSTNLVPDRLKAAADQNPNLKVNLRMHDGYNHSYFFIATFIADHIKHHADILNSK